nr:MAG TPA: hydrogenase/urease nickel incorporation protein [Caudoviricetes sp.]
MVKYINAAEAAEKVAAATGINIADLMDIFAEIPAADVAPVVHCKDCEYSWEDIGGLTCSYGCCVDCVVREDFFCADGVKMEGKK